MSSFIFTISNVLVKINYSNGISGYFQKEREKYEKFYERSEKYDHCLEIYLFDKSKKTFWEINDNRFKFFLGKNINDDVIENIIKTSISYYLTQFNKVIIHGGAVSVNNRAYIYTGASKIGKTTLSKRLFEFCLNDENIILEFKNNKVYFQNTPWVGREKLFLPIYKTLEVNSIFFLGQDDNIVKNSIGKKESIYKLLNNTLSLEERSNIKSIYLLYKNIVDLVNCFKFSWSLNNTKEELLNSIINTK